MSIEDDECGEDAAEIPILYLPLWKKRSVSMRNYLDDVQGYWDDRFRKEKEIWGIMPSKTAEHALSLFSNYNIKRILVPGAGYGRNTKLFSTAGFQVDGIEISNEALNIAKNHDLVTRFYSGSFLNFTSDDCKYDAVYCFNVMHLFRKRERYLFVQKCLNLLENKGLMYFVVFSDKEKSYGKGNQVEENTFESKPGRPVHYFTEEDLLGYFNGQRIIEKGLMEDLENHGEEGEHIHHLRYILVQKP